MKSEKLIKESVLPGGQKINSSLDDKEYDNHPYFKQKVDRANLILNKTGIPYIVKERLKK